MKKTTVSGLKVNVEHAKGSFRYFFTPNGRLLHSVQMRAAYGHLAGTKGMDAEEVDVYVGPHKKATTVYLITQMKRPYFQEVDEQKVMLGFASEEEAKETYLAHYDDPRFFGGIKAMSLDEFKAKVFSKKRQGKMVKSRVISQKAFASLQKGGPYIGPRGGKWADPQHTIPWKEPSEEGSSEEDTHPVLQIPRATIEEVLTSRAGRTAHKDAINAVRHAQELLGVSDLGTDPKTREDVYAKYDTVQKRYDLISPKEIADLIFSDEFKHLRRKSLDPQYLIPSADSSPAMQEELQKRTAEMQDKDSETREWAASLNFRPSKYNKGQWIRPDGQTGWSTFTRTEVAAVVMAEMQKEKSASNIEKSAKVWGIRTSDLGQEKALRFGVQARKSRGYKAGEKDA